MIKPKENKVYSEGNDLIYVKLQKKKKKKAVFSSSLTSVFAFDFWKGKSFYLLS